MPSRSSVSMKDVAALAGVSIGTVSNVLNSPQLVSAQTRERVEGAIDKLGWVRNESARQLRAGRSSSVGLVVMDIGNPFFTDVVAGAEEYINGQGYTVQLGNSAQQVDRESAHLQLFDQQRVRGLLIAPIKDIGERLARLRRRGIPVVVVDRAGESDDCCSVAVDDVEGGRLAVAHLIGSGHRRIAFVGGPSNLHQVRDRLLGAQAAGGESPNRIELLVVSTQRLDITSGVAAGEDIVAMSDAERPTAVFAANDLLALGLLQVFVTHGIRVPDDVAIIGYDDIQFAAAAAVPLSSVRQPRFKLGRRAAELLFEEIQAGDGDAEHTHQHVRFTPELVVRRSTGSTGRSRPA